MTPSNASLFVTIVQEYILLIITSYENVNGSGEMSTHPPMGILDLT
jgi:hypothetical protein